MNPRDSQKRHTPPLSSVTLKWPNQATAELSDRSWRSWTCYSGSSTSLAGLGGCCEGWFCLSETGFFGFESYPPSGKRRLANKGIRNSFLGANNVKRFAKHGIMAPFVSWSLIQETLSSGGDQKEWRLPNSLKLRIDIGRAIKKKIKFDQKASLSILSKGKIKLYQNNCPFTKSCACHCEPLWQGCAMWILMCRFRGRRNTLSAFSCRFHGRHGTLCTRSADFLAGAALCALEVQISWQAQRFVNLEVQISWQAREVQIGWQA